MCDACKSTFMDKVKNYIGEKSDLETEVERLTKMNKIYMAGTIGLGATLVIVLGIMIFRKKKK